MLRWVFGGALVAFILWLISKLLGSDEEPPKPYASDIARIRTIMRGLGGGEPTADECRERHSLLQEAASKGASEAEFQRLREAVINLCPNG